MKTLRQSLKIEKYVSELNGYLSAVSHLNDAVGYRHGFFADLIYLSEQPILETISEYLKAESPILQEINLKEECKIIQNFIFNNFMLGIKIEESKNLSFVKEQLIWHIQDYITIANVNQKIEKRWVYYSKQENKQETVIFVKIDKYLVVMWFNWRKEDVNT